MYIKEKIVILDLHFEYSSIKTVCIYVVYFWEGMNEIVDFWAGASKHPEVC